MSVVTLRFNGLISWGKDNDITASFDTPSMELEALLKILKADISFGKIAFVAVNGKKASLPDLVYDGDIIDFFPVVAGG